MAGALEHATAAFVLSLPAAGASRDQPGGGLIVKFVRWQMQQPRLTLHLVQKIGQSSARCAFLDSQRLSCVCFSAWSCGQLSHFGAPLETSVQLFAGKQENCAPQTVTFTAPQNRTDVSDIL